MHSGVNVFEYEGVEHNEGGEFSIVLDNAAGSDSVVTLKLDLEYVGLEESLAAESWSLYPNPATNQLSIDLSKWEGAFPVLMTNALGQVLWEQSVRGIATIDVVALQVKENIPQVAAQMPLIKSVQTETYWKEVNVARMEELRASMRDLIPYLESESQEIEGLTYQPLQGPLCPLPKPPPFGTTII